MRKVALLAVLAAALSMPAASPKRPPLAPQTLPHPIALFLDDLSNEGRRRVTFRAHAVGTRFFFEEPTGVTIYQFRAGRYVKENYLAGATLANAMAQYAAR
ncbi:MAG TPA: hypothetical protein VG106_05750 [Vicinamibacterales bacterium]|nr:hypothetical protein [Vicinamibacterales bacterium]